MHDWTLKSVSYEWSAARVTILLTSLASKDCTLVADRVVELQLGRRNEWGPSVSVNEIRGPSSVSDATKEFVIEMQSGDSIRIVAEAFCFPHEFNMR